MSDNTLASGETREAIALLKEFRTAINFVAVTGKIDLRDQIQIVKLAVMCSNTSEVVR